MKLSQKKKKFLLTSFQTQQKNLKLKIFQILCKMKVMTHLKKHSTILKKKKKKQFCKY